MNYNLLYILDKLLETKNYKEIALYLNVATGTVKRWIELKNVPNSYTFDLLKFANITIDYSQFKL